MDERRLESYPDHSRAVDLRGLAWESVREHPLPPEALRALRYMQDIETHTIIYLRELLATRAIDEPGVGDFLACWIYEEAAHGRALARFLAACGDPVPHRPRSRPAAGQRLQERMIALVSRCWPDFLGAHMTWGAINEISALAGYHRLAQVAPHPVLGELLARIQRDESRHFGFYFHQARRRLERPGVARVVHLLVRRFWGPVGSGVQPDSETRFLAEYLFSGADGRTAARKVDRTIRALPGLGDLPLLEAWLDRSASGHRRPARTCTPSEPRPSGSGWHRAGTPSTAP